MPARRLSLMRMLFDAGIAVKQKGLSRNGFSILDIGIRKITKTISC